MKIERRPNLSEIQAKPMVPMKSPVKSAATKLAKPCRSNSPCVVGLKMPPLKRPIAM